MKTTLTLHRNYSINGSYLQLCLPIQTECLIPVDESVRLLDQITEEMNYEKLYKTYSAEGRKPAVEPKTLFKIIAYAYSQGIYSSREIERACNLNLAFMYLLQGEKTPDHNTISRFRREHLSSCMEDLLTQFVQLLAENREINFENLFVDGTKIEANANKYTFVWRSAIEKNEQKLQTNAHHFLAEELGIQDIPLLLTSQYLKQQLQKLHNQVKKERIVFVYGKGKRKTELQRKSEKLQDYVERQAYYEECNQIFGKRNSFSKTDPDATFMRMKEDYMRNGQLKPGYNVQIGVENEYIVGVQLFSDRNDVNTLIPFMNRLEHNYERRFVNLIADAGYESEENYEYLTNKDITAYIKPSNYEYSKTKKYQRDMEFRLAMQYDEENDRYICKNGQYLHRHREKKRVSASGYISYNKVYECENCQSCPHYGKCYKGKQNKRIEVAEKFDAYRELSRQNITTEKGIQLRVNRSIQVEGVFGVTKQDYNFKRFLTRGQINVTTEYLLLAFGFNINKLHHRIQSGRIGLALFELKNAV